MNLSGRTLIYAILILGAIPFIAPWLWMVSASFQPQGDIFNWPPTWFPEHFTLENYKDFLEATGLFRWYVNSFFIAISVVVLQIFFNSLAGYTFRQAPLPRAGCPVRLHARDADDPGVVFLIPNYLILQHCRCSAITSWGRGDRLAGSCIGD